jgi:hypothetical protein
MRPGIPVGHHPFEPTMELHDRGFSALKDDAQDFVASFLECVEFPTNILIGSWIESMQFGHFAP